MSFVESGEHQGGWMITMRAGDQEIHLFQSKTPGVSSHFNHLSFRVESRRFKELLSELSVKGVGYSGPHRYQNTRFIKL